MRGLTDFLKTTALGGFLVLLPLLLLYLMLVELLQVVVALATPIADLVVPAPLLEALDIPVLVALLLILAASFVLGLLTRSALVKRLGRIVERRTVGALPLYGVLKSLTSQLTRVDAEHGFRPALFDGGDDGRLLAFLIEDHGDGNATVMFPRAPTPLVGTVRIVPMKHVQLLDVSLSAFTTVLGHWGAGARELLGGGGARE